VGILVELVTANNLAEVLMIQEPLREKRRARTRPDRAADLPSHELPLAHAGAAPFDGLRRVDTT
jgi:hypothetical protein